MHKHRITDWRYEKEWDGEEEAEDLAVLGLEEGPSVTFRHGRGRDGYTDTGEHNTIPTCARGSRGSHDGGG